MRAWRAPGAQQCGACLSRADSEGTLADGRPNGRAGGGGQLESDSPPEVAQMNPVPPVYSMGQMVLQNLKEALELAHETKDRAVPSKRHAHPAVPGHLFLKPYFFLS